MDKYTVDLDQVLNDFEYSELTDQQSKNAPEKPQSSTAFQPPPITKHSINNVFHSLNEYLNSEISSSIDKAELGRQDLEYDQQNLRNTDNNLIDNITESYNKVIEASDNVEIGLVVANNQLPSFESSGQNERLLKLKNDLQIVDNLEKAGNNFEHVIDRDAFTTIQLGQLDEDTKDANLLTENLQPNFLEVQESQSNIHYDNFSNMPQDKPTENIASKKSNDDFKKTDIQNFSLLDTENVESELIPGINCTKNNVKSEVESVYNDKECDIDIDNKADNYVNNEQTSFVKEESFFTVDECETAETEGNVVTTAKINDISVEYIENNENSSDNLNTNLTNVENFVIEPSESPYALGDSVQSKTNSEIKKIPENPFLGNNVKEPEENVPKPPIENVDEIQEKSSHNSQQISQNLELNNEEMLTNNISESPEENISKQDVPNKEKSILKDTTTVAEDNPGSDTDKPIILGKKIVGFSTDIDIDDNELNKLLEELEIEEGSDLDNNVSGENNFRKTECFSEEIQDSKVEKLNNENNLVLQHEETRDDMGQIENEGSELPSLNFKEQTESHKEMSLEKPSYAECVNTQLIECLEIEKPSKNKKNSLKNKEKSEKIKTSQVKTTDEELNDREDNTKSVETLQEEFSEQQVNELDVEKEAPNSLQKQQFHEALTRPQDLPLKSETDEEHATRKIDLIGSPGSTPYNNVYINKSIEPNTTQDTDSDYTSSASPTFSDCSTESTSTASTASVEDFPKNSEGAAKTHRHKYRHSEKGGLKNRESTQGKGETGADQRESNIQENSVDNSEHIQDTEGAEHNASDSSQPSAGDSQERGSQPSETFLDKSWLGKEAPLWIPDSDAATCLHCDMKFTVIKRRHHCRACGLVLCSKCCNLKFRLEYLDTEARVCTKCYNILTKDPNNPPESGHNTSGSGDSPAFRPNPNNPLEYCSTVSPLQQIGPGGAPPPSVMVPVGVLKRKGAIKKSNKSVMFCDGIAPGSDLTHLDQDFNYQETKTQKSPKSPQKVPEEVKKQEEPPPTAPAIRTSRNQPKTDQDTGCFIPKSETSLPPTVCVNKTDTLYSDCSNSPSVVEMLKNEALTFAINQNLFVQVRLINMSCCINKQAWCFSTDGLINVGSDEIVYLIEYIDEESFVPKDVFFHINNVYVDAVKGTAVKELGLSLHNTSNFLDSKNHAGFVYIRPSFQCLENVLKPKEPYLIGILIHRWETPWAKLFPLRLILRLGAEYRYYPSPLISTRHRDSVFVEIGHTIINILADFRNFTYTLPQIRGLIIHMEDKKTTISIPRNRYDQVIKSINNSSEHILAFAGNFTSEADSHLVCIQDTQGHENAYTTHAINIHNKPRKITGASFIAFNGSLKSSSGLTAKSNIVEDGLMIQIPSEQMEKIRENLRNMKNHTIACGCINATSDESVNIVWGENDVDFNSGVQSPVDLYDMKGVPSIRVHNGKDYFCNNGTRLIRWTEVFILQNGEENPKNQDPVDISKVSESIAKACCTALVKYLDLLVSNSCQKIGIRTTLHVENVSYSAGSNGLKLPPIYMRSLDNELIPVLHKITSNNLGDNAVELELIFRILNA